MKVTKDNVEQFIGRFMEGETSNAEEAALYKFFREENIPEKLKMYKPMFAYFEGGLKREEPLVHEPHAQKRWRRYILPVITGVAACFIGAVGFMHYEQKQNLYNSYSGSYVIEHGRRLSDIRQIMPKLKMVEMHADEAELQHRSDRLTKNVLNDIADPSIRAAAAEVLK